MKEFCKWYVISYVQNASKMHKICDTYEEAKDWIYFYPDAKVLPIPTPFGWVVIGSIVGWFFFAFYLF